MANEGLLVEVDYDDIHEEEDLPSEWKRIQSQPSVKNVLLQRMDNLMAQ